MKKFLWNAAFCALVVCGTGCAMSIAVWAQGGAFEGWWIFLAPQAATSTAVFANLWLAVVMPLFRSTPNSMQAPEQFAWRSSMLGAVIQLAGGITCTALCRNREPFNVAVVCFVATGAGYLGLMSVSVGRHAARLVKVIRDNNSNRVSLGINQNTELEECEKRVNLVSRLAMPMAVNLLVVAMIPLILYVSSGTGPMMWLIPHLTGVSTVAIACVTVDSISARRSREATSPIPLTPDTSAIKSMTARVEQA